MIGTVRRPGPVRRPGRLVAGALIALLATGCGGSWPPDDPPRYTPAGGARTVVPDLRTATTLTGEQHDALAAGRTLTLDERQSAALDTALRSLDDRTIDQIATLTATDPGAFADAIQLASNPRVVPVGGEIPLPTAVDTLVTAPPTQPLGSGLHQRVRYSWQQVHHAAGPIAVPRLNEIGTLADLLAAGRPDLQVDTSVDRDLIALAGQLADIGADRRFDLVAGPGAPPLDRAAVHTVLVDLLEVAGRDPDAAHDAITGTDMPDGYRADTVTVALLAHPWSSDQQPIVDLIAAATAAPTTAANATTAAIAHTMAAHRSALTAVAGAGGRSMGELNPAVTRAVTDAVATRLAGLAGTPRQPVDGVAPMPDTDTLAEAFRVLLTNGPSGLYLAAAVDTTTRDLAVDFGHHPETPANGAVIGRLTAGLRAAEADTAPLLRADVARSSTTDRYTAVLRGLLLSRPEIAADPAIAPFLDGGSVRPITDSESATFEAEIRAWCERAKLPFAQFQHDLYAEVGDRGWYI